MAAEPSTTITFETPDLVVLEYRRAGILHRFLALLIDDVIQFVGLLLLTLWIPEVVPSLGRYVDIALAWVISLVVFLVLGGYFMVFEYVWRGQTPGKRLARIRVIRVGGYPLSVREAVLRNVFRLIDFLPGNAAVGVTSIFMTRFEQRIGDLVAGTVVVSEPRLATAGSLSEVPLALPADAKNPFDASNVVVDFLTRREEFDPKERHRLSERLVTLNGLVRSDDPAERERTLYDYVSSLRTRRR
jgi:uncharacterized RDD family membrane protein YckC